MNDSENSSPPQNYIPARTEIMERQRGGALTSFVGIQMFSIFIYFGLTINGLIHIQGIGLTFMFRIVMLALSTLSTIYIFRYKKLGITFAWIDTAIYWIASIIVGYGFFGTQSLYDHHHNNSIDSFVLAVSTAIALVIFVAVVLIALIKTILLSVPSARRTVENHFT